VIRTQDPQPGASQSVSIRRVRPADPEALRNFFLGLSMPTRYLRFFGALSVGPAMLRILSGGDNADAVVATGDGAIIGHGIATYRVGRAETLMTEIGVVVADAWQGKGVGSALVRALMAAARARGASVLTMDVLPANRKVLAMVASHWPTASMDHCTDGVVVRVRLQGQQAGLRLAQRSGHELSGSFGTVGRSNQQREPSALRSPAARSLVHSAQRSPCPQG
jgi:GNAT superfamily N-acetyltransferase